MVYPLLSGYSCEAPNFEFASESSELFLREGGFFREAFALSSAKFSLPLTFGSIGVEDGIGVLRESRP